MTRTCPKCGSTSVETTCNRSKAAERVAYVAFALMFAAVVVAVNGRINPNGTVFGTMLALFAAIVVGTLCLPVVITLAAAVGSLVTGKPRVYICNDCLHTTEAKAVGRK